jgi:hypothetical protein
MKDQIVKSLVQNQGSLNLKIVSEIYVNMLRHNDWFIPLKQEKNAYIRLFCFHHGGGSASIFRKWSKDLMDDAELVAIQLPGREERFNEPLLNNVFQIVNNLCQNFNNYLDNANCELGGWEGVV